MLRSVAICVVSPVHIDGQASDERRSASRTTRIWKKGWMHSTQSDFRPYIENFTVLPTPAHPPICAVMGGRIAYVRHPGDIQVS
jgi:hypothetical protein